MSRITILLLLFSSFALTILSLLTNKNQPNCEQYTSQLINLFNFMCNNVANEIEIIRDACMYCFQRATRANNNQPSLTELNNCAATHLLDTRYESCINLLNNLISNPGNGQCVTGYCRFVRCIRRSNSDLLIAQCYGEAIIDNDAIVEQEQVSLVKNITSCILARTRCALINPITGQPQRNRFNTTTYDKWGKPKINSVPLYNSLQITPEGDLRIVAFPETTKIQNYFCTAVNLQESTWMEYSC